MKTEIIKESDPRAIRRAVSVLKRGGIVVYPTDTQYGIGADVMNKKAVRKVFDAKHRPIAKDVIWACSSISMAKNYFPLSIEQERLANALMPGPLTLVLGNETFRFRIPSNEFSMKMIRKFGKPVTTTSANISGKKPSSKIKDIISIFGDKVDLIIDAGDLKPSRPSTVLKWEGMKILRRGPVAKKSIMDTIKSILRK